MAIKHAASHGFATLLGTVLAGMLVGLARNALPSLSEAFHGTGSWLSNLLFDWAEIRIAADTMSGGLLAGTLAASWGAVWSFMHRDRA